MGLRAEDGRKAGIDLVRGVLTLAVILGHFSELTHRHSLMTWMGAGLRMPLFIGLTGYLFHLERARAMPLETLLRRYGRRLILPWLVATTVYLTVTWQISYLTPLSILFHPPFHLWFVPILMAFILIAAAVRLPAADMVGLAIPISIAAMYLFGVGHANHIATAAWLPDRRFFIYPIYFFYGIWVARRPPDRGRERAALLLAPLGFLWWCALYDAPADIPAEVAASLLSSLPLIYLLPRAAGMSISMPMLQVVGRDSLFYYLWHPMAFGLWACTGVRGPTMLLLSMLTLVAMRAIAVRHPSVARLFGVLPRRRALPADVAPIPVATPHGQPS